MKRQLEYKLTVHETNFTSKIDPQVLLLDNTLKIFAGADRNYKTSTQTIDLQIDKKKITRGTLTPTEFKVGESTWQFPTTTLLFGGRSNFEESRNKFTNMLQKMEVGEGWEMKVLKGEFGNRPCPRELMKSVVIDDQSVLVVGGCDGNRAYDDMYLLSVAGGVPRWKYLGKLGEIDPKMPFGKFSLCKVRDKIYLTGGLKKQGERTELVRQLYSINIKSLHTPVFQKQKPQFGRMIPVADHQTAVVDNRYIIVTGGQTTHSNGFNNYTIEFIPNTDIWCYDTDVRQWFRLFTNVSPRIRGRTYAKGTEVFIFGGLRNPESFNTSLEVISFYGFKFDRTCEVCNNSFNLRMTSDYEQPQNPTNDKQAEKNLTFINTLYNYKSLVGAAEFKNRQAIKLLIYNSEEHSASSVYVRLNRYHGILEITDNAVVTQNDLKIDLMSKYLTNVVCGGMKLSGAFVFISYNFETKKRSVVLVDTREGKDKYKVVCWTKAEKQQEQQPQRYREVIMQTLKKYRFWEEVVNHPYERKDLKCVNKLFIVGLKLAVDYKTEDLKQYLSSLYLKQKITLYFQNQPIPLHQDLQKYSPFIGYEHQIIKSYMTQQQLLPTNPQNSNKKQTRSYILIYQNNKFLFRFFHSFCFGDKLRVKLIVELHDHVEVNILRNKMVHGGQEKQLKREIKSLAVNYETSESNSEVGEWSIKRESDGHSSQYGWEMSPMKKKKK